MAVATYTKAGAKAASPAKLPKEVFGVSKVNHNLLKEAYLSYLAKGRGNLAKAKKRGEVRGGGAKPWRQKGTGRARFGSSRNPIWTGGGVAFGPTGTENYTRNLSSAAKKSAIQQALSMAATEDRIAVIDDFEIKDGKVNTAAKLLNKINAAGSVLLALESKNEMVSRATNNLKNVKVVQANYLNVYDVMNSDVLIITKPALESLVSRLGGKNE